MTIDLDVLEGLAKAANQPGGDPWYVADDLLTQSYGQLLSQDRRFIASASPAAVLLLIAAARALDQVWNTTHPTTGYSDLSARRSAFKVVDEARQALKQETQS